MNKSIFITGTGTDVGKTYISGLLAKLLTGSGLDCGYYKPVLSGAVQECNILHPGDCEFVISMGNLKQCPMESLTYVFEDAVSPHLAARYKNITIDKSRIIQDFKHKLAEHEYLIVEGAGGITCPLKLDKEVYLMSDLIKDLGLEIIITADAGLGTINSVLLTVEYAKLRGINIVGVILNRYVYSNAMYEDNIKTIEYLCGTPVIGLVETGSSKIDTLGYNFPELFQEV